MMVERRRAGERLVEGAREGQISSSVNQKKTVSII